MILHSSSSNKLLSAFSTCCTLHLLVFLESRNSPSCFISLLNRILSALYSFNTLTTSFCTFLSSIAGNKVNCLSMMESPYFEFVFLILHQVREILTSHC